MKTLADCRFADLAIGDKVAVLGLLGELRPMLCVAKDTAQKRVTLEDATMLAWITWQDEQWQVALGDKKRLAQADFS